MIKPLRNKIMFQFLSEIDRRTSLFKEETDSGIIVLSTPEHTTESPRWGKIVALGGEVCPEVTMDTYILIAPMMWTEKIVHDDMELWQTEDTHVMAVSDTIPDVGF